MVVRPAAVEKVRVAIPTVVFKTAPVIAMPAEEPVELIPIVETTTGFDLVRKIPSSPNTSPAGIYFLLMDFWILKVVDVVRFLEQANQDQYW